MNNNIFWYCTFSIGGSVSSRDVLSAKMIFPFFFLFFFSNYSVIHTINNIRIYIIIIFYKNKTVILPRPYCISKISFHPAMRIHRLWFYLWRLVQSKQRTSRCCGVACFVYCEEETIYSLVCPIEEYPTIPTQTVKIRNHHYFLSHMNSTEPGPNRWKVKYYK